jgi:hypothetical protein
LELLDPFLLSPFVVVVVVVVVGVPGVVVEVGGAVV